MSGIDALRQRRKPAPRHPRSQHSEADGSPTATAAQAVEQGAQARRALENDDDQVALAVRVPRVLYNRLVALTAQLTLQGVEVTLADLVALALQGLPEEANPALMYRLRGE